MNSRLKPTIRKRLPDQLGGINQLSEKDTEIWQDIPNFPNYEVSNQGEIRNKKTSRILKPYSTKGYLRVSLYNEDGKRSCKLVHRLLAEAFLSNPESKPVVNHISGNKSDANAINLEWVTASENMSHAHRTKLRPVVNTKGEKNGFAKLTRVTATEIKRLALFGHLTQKEIATRFNISRSTVQDIKSARRWQHLT